MCNDNLECIIFNGAKKADVKDRATTKTDNLYLLILINKDSIGKRSENS